MAPAVLSRRHALALLFLPVGDHQLAPLAWGQPVHGHAADPYLAVVQYGCHGLSPSQKPLL